MQSSMEQSTHSKILPNHTWDVEEAGCRKM